MAAQETFGEHLARRSRIERARAGARLRLLIVGYVLGLFTGLGVAFGLFILLSVMGAIHYG